MRKRRRAHWYEENSWWFAEVKGAVDKSLVGKVYLEKGHLVLYSDNPQKRINLGKMENISGIAKKLTTHIAKTMLGNDE
jgi:hypothetical protein